MTTQNNITKSILAGFFSILLSSAAAQTSDIQKVRIGLKFNPVFNWVKVMEGTMENNGVPMSVGYGVMMDFNIAKNPNYWLSTEFNVTTFSNKLKSSTQLFINNNGTEREFNDVELHYKSQMIQVPITLKLKSNEIGNASYFGQFGFVPGVAYSNTLKTTAKEQFYAQGVNSHTPNSSSNDDLDFNGQENTGENAFEDNILPIRFGMLIGLGAEFKISGKTTAMAALQFNNGIVDQFLDNRLKGRTNYLGLNLGVFF